MDFATIYQNLQATASLHPDQDALTAPDREALTYRQLVDQVSQWRRQLVGLGIERNDRVAIVLPNGPDMATTFLSVASAATAAPLNPVYRAPELDFYLADLQAKALVVDPTLDSPAIAVAESRQIPVIRVQSSRRDPAGRITLEPSPACLPPEPPVGPDDVALILHTSGTTSRPKIVPLSQRNLCESADNICRGLELGCDDCVLNIMPLFHIHGLVAAVLSTLVSGGTLACTPGFVATEFFAWLQRVRPSWYTAVPTMHQAIVARAEGCGEVIASSRLRFIRSSSSPLPPPVAHRIEEVFGVPVIEAYGMTEAAHQICSNPLPPATRKFGSVGPAAGPQVAIMNANGERLEPDTVGEVVIRGTNVTPGYESNPEANAQSFTHGWFRTGDEGRFDTDGYLFLTGRIKEIINRGGEKISPREIDEVLLEHPKVTQAVTFAIADDRLGEEVAAAVVLGRGQTSSEHELMAFAARSLAEFKVPRRVVIVEEIPKGPSGKLQRIGLAKQLGLEATSEPGRLHEHVEPRDDIEQTLTQICRDVLKVDRLGVHDSFFDHGGDSILASQVIGRVRQQLQEDLPILVFFESPTVAGMARALRASKTGQDAQLSNLVEELERMTDQEAQRMLSDP